MKLVLSNFLIVFYLSFVIGHWSFVHASYVLPYPSYMPGNKLYKVSRMVDGFKKYWYFGNIAKTKYYLALSDKYLVEAKTLFEYKQYLLAVDALSRSDSAYTQLSRYVASAKSDKKDISLLKAMTIDSAEVHRNVLETIKKIVPERVTWSPEHEKPTQLALHNSLTFSIRLRERIISEISSR